MTNLYWCFALHSYPVGKPHRWSQYDAEMEACFQRLEELFVARSKNNSHSHSYSHSYMSSSGCETAVSSERSAAGLYPQTDNNYQANNNNNREDDASEDGVLLRYALEFFYLWVTFAPLSRGR